VRPTTILALIGSVVMGLGAFVVGVALILDHHALHAKWHYWIAPVVMMGIAIALWQISAMYMVKVGRYELRNRPPDRG